MDVQEDGFRLSGQRRVVHHQAFGLEDPAVGGNDVSNLKDIKGNIETSLIDNTLGARYIKLWLI